MKKFIIAGGIAAMLIVGAMYGLGFFHRSVSAVANEIDDGLASIGIVAPRDPNIVNVRVKTADPVMIDKRLSGFDEKSTPGIESSDSAVNATTPGVFKLLDNAEITIPAKSVHIVEFELYQPEYPIHMEGGMKIAARTDSRIVFTMKEADRGVQLAQMVVGGGGPIREPFTASDTIKKHKFATESGIDVGVAAVSSESRPSFIITIENKGGTSETVTVNLILSYYGAG